MMDKWTLDFVLLTCIKFLRKGVSHDDDAYIVWIWKWDESNNSDSSDDIQPKVNSNYQIVMSCVVSVNNLSLFYPKLKIQ